MSDELACVPAAAPLVSTVVTKPMPRAGDAPRLVLRMPDGREHVLMTSISIGQSSKNDITIRDEATSRRHCVIDIFGTRAVVRDLESTNGTFVNGARVSSAELHAGATLMVGATRIRVGVQGIDESEILGTSVAMCALRGGVERLAGTSLTVLINGETGTGKELVAFALHARSGRKGAFVPLNCGAISKDLVESELFGHERGAFTGASDRRRGVFQEADGGTLFLDEIGELPLGMQTRLLRALETGMVRPVGSAREVRVEVRVVAATHVDLRAAVFEGRFRRDLFYRLAGATLTSPPLRERPEDVVLLARRFLEELSAEHGRCVLAPEGYALLANHPWPGNVRELRNVLRRAVALHGPIIGPDELDLESGLLDCRTRAVSIDNRSFTEIEKDVLATMINKHRGNRRKAAQELDIPKSSLCDKVKRYGIVVDPVPPRRR
jgi:two-component system, NtrC family, response regulator HydG